MKKFILYITAIKQVVMVPTLLIISCTSAFSQLKITTGTNLVTTGNVQIVLADLDFYNAGIMNNMASTFQFSGTANSSITDANDAMFFNNITVNKTGGKQLNLHTTLYVDGQVIFVSGNIELTDKYILLGTTGSLIGETEASHATSLNYGLINATAFLNAPNAVNIANLGAVITSAANLGNVTVTRTFYSSDIAAAGGKSINRGYEFNPTNNNNLNATLTIKYFDSELNGIPENSLTHFESTDFITYHNTNYSARDPAANYVTQTGYNKLSKFTLGKPNIGLPVTGLDFSAKCVSTGKVQLDWKTQQEFSNAGFFIERKTDKENTFTQKSFIASKAANGNSVLPLTYQLIDTNSYSGKMYYRLKQTDLNGASIYSLIRVIDGMNVKGGSLTVWPVPAVSDIHIKIEGITKDVAQLWDAAGRMVQQLTVENGQAYTLEHLSAGTYFIRLLNNKDISQKIIIQ